MMLQVDPVKLFWDYCSDKSLTKIKYRKIRCYYFTNEFNFILLVVLCCSYIIISRVKPIVAIESNIINNNVNLHSTTQFNIPNKQSTSGGSSKDEPTKQQLLHTDNGESADDDYFDESEEIDEYTLLTSNKSAKGMYIGAPCNYDKCDTKLNHVACDLSNNICSCEKNYPVIIGLTKGCARAKKLGDQCFYHQTCTFNDPNSLCVQVKHNALCQCSDGYHSVTYSKPTKRIFCTQDMAVLTSDLPTLLGVTTGIAVLAGLICMVLHLFSKNKYPRHRSYGDANIPPPIMYSSDTEIPLTVHSARPSSRSSLRSSNSICSYGNRRPSSAPQSGSKGVLVSTSRTGSRRPSLASVHSTSSSIRSYSTTRIEKELQQKELRQEMKLRLARLQQQQYHQQHKPHIIIGDPLLHGVISKNTMPTPSPLTPNSTDELLPSVDEAQEFSPPISIHADSSYIGPYSSNDILIE